MGYPMPVVWPHVVTIGREQRNHNNAELAKGDPLILRGMMSWGLEWNEINTTFRDVLIYNVPIHMRARHEFIKGSAFVFEVDGLCVCHTGDVGEPFNEDQLDLIGHVDIVLLPIGGTYAMDPESAKKVVEQLKPKIAVPMHYRPNTTVLEEFLDGPYQARFLETNTFSVSKDTLPSVTEIFIPKVIWYGHEDL
jgi:L-ascorbate metabolism protein UlaG (beta-lactamase superfamily)